MASRRKPGLLFPCLRVEIEEVKKAHKKPCCACGAQPESRRLHVTKGSGRHQQQEIRCMECGVNWLNDRRAEIHRAVTYLQTGEGECRL